MLNEIITLHFVSCAVSLKNLAEGLHHFMSIRLSCDAREKISFCGLHMQSDKDNRVVTVYVWSNTCLEQRTDNSTNVQHNAIYNAMSSSQ